jgi:hypothetical protein
MFIQAVCSRIGLNLIGFESGNKKRKYLMKTLPDDSVSVPYFIDLKTAWIVIIIIFLRYFQFSKNLMWFTTI